MKALQKCLKNDQLIALLGLFSFLAMIVAAILTPPSASLSNSRNMFIVSPLVCFALISIWLVVSFWYKVKVVFNKNSFWMGAISVWLFMLIAFIMHFGVRHFDILAIETSSDYLGTISLGVFFCVDIVLLLFDIYDKEKS